MSINKCQRIETKLHEINTNRIPNVQIRSSKSTGKYLNLMSALSAFLCHSTNISRGLRERNSYESKGTQWEEMKRKEAMYESKH